MQNVQIETKGALLVITIDTSKAGTPSKTGKSMIIASTGGSATVPGKPGLKLGLNLFQPH